MEEIGRFAGQLFARVFALLCLASAALLVASLLPDAIRPDWVGPIGPLPRLMLALGIIFGGAVDRWL